MDGSRLERDENKDAAITQRPKKKRASYERRVAIGRTVASRLIPREFRSIENRVGKSVIAMQREEIGILPVTIVESAVKQRRRSYRVKTERY